MNPCFFTAPSPLHLFAIASVLGSRIAGSNSIFSVQTFTRRTPHRNAQVRVSKNWADHGTDSPFQGGEIHLHPSWRYGWSILSRIVTAQPYSSRRTV